MPWDIDLSFFVIVVVVFFVVVSVLKGSRRPPDGSEGMAIVCRSCGAAHPEYAKFCRRCGKKL